ncbi:hypothetical protein NPIL_702081 [Nephila pilipes]|uniref:Uncharacterized protein n=1 Tax=Nephila pilipes TaxID=299642 RepID=A0A8X6U869_NEPPI|nr:hypothetical protein NPIL_702081 [Nephila pilipes]
MYFAESTALIADVSGDLVHPNGGGKLVCGEEIRWQSESSSIDKFYTSGTYVHLNSRTHTEKYNRYDFTPLRILVSFDGILEMTMQSFDKSIGFLMIGTASYSVSTEKIAQFFEKV